MHEWCGDRTGAMLPRMQAFIPNIGPKQRRRRLVLGGVSLAAAAAIAAALVAGDASLALRTIVALPLYGAALGFFQYREKT
jgi:hypothetical protein